MNLLDVMRRLYDSEEGCATMIKSNTLKAVFISLVVAASLSPNEATPSVIYRLSGTVIEAPENALPEVGDVVFGFVELSDRAYALSPPYEFALGHGDALDIFIRFGPYVWDLDRPSVRLVGFEGFLSPDKQSIGNYSLNMLENFFGVISDQYCAPRQVCQLTGGGNGIMALHDGLGLQSLARTTWTFEGRIPEPSTFSLLALSVLGLVLTRRHKR